MPAKNAFIICKIIVIHWLTLPLNRQRNSIHQINELLTRNNDTGTCDRMQWGAREKNKNPTRIVPLASSTFSGDKTKTNLESRTGFLIKPSTFRGEIKC